jgi:archaellum component FlaG (FlaF/FlaG flagellin family)
MAFSTGCSRSKGGNKASADAATSAPKIEVVNKLHDFGTATEGDKPKHVFQIKNTGSGPLVLDRVTTSCGCTTAVIKNKEIAPGDTGEIEVTFDTTARRGANRKSVTVLSNDPSNPRTQLEVTINVESLLAFDPFFVRLTPEYGEEQVREAWLVGKLIDQAKIAVTERGEDKDVVVEPAEKDEGGKKVHGLRFRLKGKKVGYGSGRVVVSTGIEKPNQLVLRYSWNVKGNLRVLPAQLYFDDKRPGAKERTLKVSSSKSDFKLKSVQVQSGPFKAVAEKPDASAEATYEIKVTLQDGAAPKPDNNGEVGKLVIVSNDPLEPKKEVSLKMASGRPIGARPPMPGMMPLGSGAPMLGEPPPPPPPPPANP